MRKAMAVLAIGVLLAVAACSDDGDGKAATGPTEQVANKKDTTTTEPKDVTNAAALAMKGSKEIDPSPDDPLLPGAVRKTYEVGPIEVKPGQNNISYQGGQVPKPEESGWIVRMAPNIRREDGTVPPVDVIHLHHGVWLNMSRKDMTRPGLPERFMAAGEEKTVFTAPDGYGYRFEKTDKWLINYMLHNLWPKGEKIWITYTLDFIPDTAPQAADIQAATPLWMDVENGSTYPVFDVLKGTGEDGRFTYPDDADEPYGDDPPDNRFTVPADGTLVATGGHLHPGGIQTDLWVERSGAAGRADVTTKEGREDTAHLFTSVAKYYEPAGAVSWDVSMFVTPSDYGVALRKGDVLETTATYDSERASWYESMGIMLSWFVPGGSGGDDPFATPVDVKGVLTHGHLAENDNHGGAPNPKDYSDLTDLPSVPAPEVVPIENFVYARGDMSVANSVPTVKAGGTITFDNSIDAPLENGIWHTITSCKAPCNRSTGIAYPLADGDPVFDSGELGEKGPPTAGRLTWTTPSDLPDGTYTYFCRIHPFMRGAFRVDG
jgi:plastocyanin